MERYSALLKNITIHEMNDMVQLRLVIIVIFYRKSTMIKANELPDQALNKSFEEIFESDDRTAVIVSGSILDEILKRMLLSYLIPNKKIEEKLLDGMAPLSTFSARINMLFFLGLITKHQFDDLNLIKKIRNMAAHHIEGIDLEKDMFKDMIRSLHCLKDTNPPKDLLDLPVKIFFKYNVTLLSGILNSNSSKIKSVKPYDYKKNITINCQ